jgi:glutathione synthase/RimK-type ligase-like ATP-grasp enzyme
MNSLKIGIVLNYKNAERKKDELIKIKQSTNIDNGFVINKKKNRYVPADVALGLYLIDKYNVQIDFIKPNEISSRRFNKNDIVFVIIYDLVEAFHLSSPKQFNIYKNVLKNSKNVYPPYQYQKFINNKCTYYKYLEKKGIPVAPTYCVTKEKWFSRNPNQYITNLIKKFNRNKWKSIVAKPVYGQESIDFAKFMNIKNNRNTFLKLKRYFSRIIHKYKGIVIQEFIKGFDKKNPEFRMFFLNGVYSYCIITVDGDVKKPVQENGTYRIDDQRWDYLKKFANRVIGVLPKIQLGNNLVDNILIRIDIGSGLEDVPYSYFINEVEFVPSLYIEDQKYPVIQTLGNSLLKVGEYYQSFNNQIKTIF